MFHPSSVFPDLTAIRIKRLEVVWNWQRWKVKLPNQWMERQEVVDQAPKRLRCWPLWCYAIGRAPSSSSQADAIWDNFQSVLILSLLPGGGNAAAVTVCSFSQSQPVHTAPHHPPLFSVHFCAVMYFPVKPQRNDETPLVCWMDYVSSIALALTLGGQMAHSHGCTVVVITITPFVHTSEW